MLTINKLITVSPVDFAAEELKKYLRMMMPECGDIKISYNPKATDGFRLGLMQDLGLDVSDVTDTELDDIIYIKCDTDGGIIAGDNPRSVLLAVYEYLRQNGCRFLLPGVDGEFIPMQDIAPVTYRHRASMRYRGWCNEGAAFQQCMLDAIDFAPKVGMNTFMLEFRVPVPYYASYYKHSHNSENRPPEPISNTTALQWKRQTEVEINKRGLQLHDVGHGFTADPFGLDSSLREWMGDNEQYVTDEIRPFLAMMNGERKLYRNRPNFTNFCMSNPVAQKKFAEYVAEYAENHSNSDFLHVWLADLQNNHCECEECQKQIPSDFYMLLMNMVDEELTKKGLDTRIVFIVYVDTSWPPINYKIKNEKRFSMLFAPISRRYTKTLPEWGVRATTVPYVRNKLTLPRSLEEYFAYLAEWKKVFHGSTLAYEYHFWYHQCFDLSGIELSKRVSEDIKTYKEYGIEGIIEDGSQRSFFPTGLAFYTYARTLYDSTLTPEEIAKDYFDTAFGEGSDEIYAYLKRVGEAFDYYYLEKERSENPKISPFFSPKRSKALTAFGEIEAEGRLLIEKYYNSEYRFRTVSVRLLEHHLDMCHDFAKIMAAKAVGNDERASELFEEFRISFGKRECEIERYCDVFYYLSHYGNIIKQKSNLDEPIIANVEQ